MFRLISWLRNRRRERFERWLTARLQQIHAGECLCFESEGYYVDCPQAPQHRLQSYGERPFRCDNGHLVMQRDWPPICAVCGSTSFVEVDIQEVMTRHRTNLIKRYSGARPVGLLGEYTLGDKA